MHGQDDQPIRGDQAEIVAQPGQLIPVDASLVGARAPRVGNDDVRRVDVTVRARLEAHRTNPSCNGCHGVIDPLGFALENFDAVGRWRLRDRESGDAIDATGMLADGRSVDGPVELREAILSLGSGETLVLIENGEYKI